MGCERDCLEKKKADRIEMTGMFCYKKWSAAQHSTAQYSTTQHSSAQHCKVQCKAVLKKIRNRCLNVSHLT
jgi:hypothetical protein